MSRKSEAELCKAPKGKIRVIAIDAFDYNRSIFDFKGFEKAEKKAQRTARWTTECLLFDDTGKCLLHVIEGFSSVPSLNQVLSGNYPQFLSTSVPPTDVLLLINFEQARLLCQ